MACSSEREKRDDELVGCPRLAEEEVDGLAGAYEV